MLKVSLEDIMTENVVRLKETATVGQAAHILLRFRINGVIIVSSGNKDKVVGIITTTDLLKLLDAALAKHGHRIDALKEVSNIPVKIVSSSTVKAVQKNTKLEKIIALMHRHNIHTIPVFDKDELVGVVGRHDILNAAYG